jgi:hypothetical protein
LQKSEFSGNIGIVTSPIFPALPDTEPALRGGFCVSGAERSMKKRRGIAPHNQES